MDIESALDQLKASADERRLIMSGLAKIEDLSEFFYTNLAALKSKAALAYAVEFATRWAEPVQLSIGKDGQLKLSQVAPSDQVEIFDDMSCAVARSSWLAKQLVSSS